MKKELVDVLIESLKSHLGIITPDEPFFRKILDATEIPQSMRFYEELHGGSQLIQESPYRYHHLSLRRVIRNNNAEGYWMGALKRFWARIEKRAGAYSSTTLLRRIREDPELLNGMSKSPCPFSLLGKFETYDHDNEDHKLFRITRPILVIPGTERQLVETWESANTVYETEEPLFFFPLVRRMKRTTAKQATQL